MIAPSWAVPRWCLAGLVVALCCVDTAVARKRRKPLLQEAAKAKAKAGQKILAHTIDTAISCTGDESWVGAVDPDGACHRAPEDIDPCDAQFHMNPDVRPFEGQPEEALVTGSIDYSMAQVLCYGVKYLGSREAALEEIAHADSSYFTVNGTSWHFNFPHENYRRIFFAESKILNADQKFEERMQNQADTIDLTRSRRLREVCPKELGQTACSIYRTLGNGIPMVMDKLPKDSEGIMIDTGIHIGTETVYLAKKFPKVHIYSIEPSRKNCFYIMWNLLMNGISPSRVTILHKFFGAENKDDTKLVDWGMRQGGSEGAWMRTGVVEEEDGEVFTDFKPESDPNKKKLWRQGIVDTVGTINLRSVLAMAKEDHGVEQALFLRLNCEGCEFEVVPDKDFQAVAKSSVQYIGGEVHAECTNDIRKLVPSMEQLAIKGAALSVLKIAEVYQTLCTDVIWPAANRDFLCHECTDQFWDSSDKALKSQTKQRQNQLYDNRAVNAEIDRAENAANLLQ
jgi:FkbM family methyltransferase